MGQTKAIRKGKVTVYQDSLVAQLIRRNALLNETKMSMPGYRIQIYFGTDRNKANEIRTGFITDYRDVPAYLVYHQPNFKVRIGDFKTRLEAVKAMQVISISYSNAFIVKDEIPLPKLDTP